MDQWSVYGAWSLCSGTVLSPSLPASLAQIICCLLLCSLEPQCQASPSVVIVLRCCSTVPPAGAWAWAHVPLSIFMASVVPALQGHLVGNLGGVSVSPSLAQVPSTYPEATILWRSPICLGLGWRACRKERCQAGPAGPIPGTTCGSHSRGMARHSPLGAGPPL